MLVAAVARVEAVRVDESVAQEHLGVRRVVVHDIPRSGHDIPATHQLLAGDALEGRLPAPRPRGPLLLEHPASGHGEVTLEAFHRVMERRLTGRPSNARQRSAGPFPEPG